MKRVIALFLSAYLLLAGLVPGNSFFELSSMPSLVKHYQYHRTVESPGISFLSFIKLHYANPKHQKSDPRNHCNLPLQHKGEVVPMDEIVNGFTSNAEAGIFHLPVASVILYNSLLPGNCFSPGVFHPPSVLS